MQQLILAADSGNLAEMQALLGNTFQAHLDRLPSYRKYVAAHQEIREAQSKYLPAQLDEYYRICEEIRLKYFRII